MQKRKIDLELPLFLLWPFGSFLLALRSIPSRKSGFIYVLFTTLFGYAFSFTTISADSYRVAWGFTNSHYTIEKIFFNYSIGAITDVYKSLMYSLTQLFSENPKVLFALFGFVFGFFSYISLKLILDIKWKQRDKFVAIIALVYFASNAIININGARFYTAAIIALCAIINLYYYNRRIWIIALVATIFIHFSYLFIVPVIILFYFLRSFLFKSKNTPKWIYLAFYVGFFLSFLSDTNLLNVDFLSGVLSTSVADKVELYNSSELSERYEERGETFFHTVSRSFSTIVKVYLFIIVLYIKRRLKNDVVLSEKLQMLFSFVLLFFAITFALSIVPSGGRFITIANQLFLFFLVHYYLIDNSKNTKRLIIGLLPAFAFLLLFQIGYLGIVLTSSTIWYGNLIWLIYEGWDYTFVYL